MDHFSEDSVHRIEKKRSRKNLEEIIKNLWRWTFPTFFELLKLMHYRPKKIKGSKEEFFIYRPKLIKNRRLNKNKKISNNNPFGKLSELRFR